MRAVDLFCGAGGFTTGATAAGLEVVACVDHWRTAVDTHAANHPAAQHLCQDVALMDPRDLPRFDVLLASPACQGHSRARGKDQPHHDAMRATAWCVVDVAEACSPRWLFVENVPDMLRWRLYRHWRAALTELGYRITETVLDAADFRVPQNRSRLIIAATRDARAPVIAAPKRTHIPASSFIRIDDGPWSPVAGHAPRTLERIAAAQARHGSDVLVPYYGNAKGGRSLERPIGTITTVDRYALVRGDRMRMLSVDELRDAMAFPIDYVLTGNRRDRVKQLGNAVCPPVARAVIEQAMGLASESRAA
jgi:DNA (cytosine-5)-methyltransferase 1